MYKIITETLPSQVKVWSNSTLKLAGSEGQQTPSPFLWRSGSSCSPVMFQRRVKGTCSLTNTAFRVPLPQNKPPPPPHPPGWSSLEGWERSGEHELVTLEVQVRHTPPHCGGGKGKKDKGSKRPLNTWKNKLQLQTPQTSPSWFLLTLGNWSLPGHCFSTLSQQKLHSTNTYFL